MAKIITIAQRKGGAGKTTLTCQLAIAFAAQGFRLRLLDTDDQASLTMWAKQRAARDHQPGLICSDAAGFRFTSALAEARRSADLVLIDTPPLIDASVKRTCAASDLILAPLQLSPLDLDATLPTARLAGSLRKDILFIINRAPPRARIADMIRAQLHASKLPVAQSELGNRAAFTESLAAGRGALETDPHGSASQEIRALADEIAGMLAITANAA